MTTLRSLVPLLALSWLLLVGGAQSASGRQEESLRWFPEGMLDDFAEDLAKQIQAIDGASEGDGAAEPAEEIVQKARNTLYGLAGNIEKLGVEGLIEIAPRHPGLELPSSGHDALDAVARWGLCSAFLQEVYHDVHGAGYAVEQRVSAAVGMAVLPLVSGPLREVLLEEDVSDEQMKAYLASEESSALFDRVWNDPELLDRTREQCSPALARVFSGE